MSILQAIVLGIVQGLTEFLPISSSGHLILIPTFFAWPDQGLAFDAILHIATLLAVIVFFRKKIAVILTSMYSANTQEQKNYRRIGWYILLATIPAAVVGMLFEDQVEQLFRSPVYIAINLIVWGIVLFCADKYQQKRQKHHQGKKLTDLNAKQSFCIGLAQALALIPGTSRSGITISTGLFLSLSKKDAAEFSFLLSIPIIGSAGMLKVIELFQHGLGELTIGILVVGFVSALVSGLLAIWGLLKIIEKWSFVPFVIYRLLLGIFIMFFLVL